MLHQKGRALTQHETGASSVERARSRGRFTFGDGQGADRVQRRIADLSQRSLRSSRNHDRGVAATNVIEGQSDRVQPCRAARRQRSARTLEPELAHDHRARKVARGSMVQAMAAVLVLKQGLSRSSQLFPGCGDGRCSTDRGRADDAGFLRVCDRRREPRVLHGMPPSKHAELNEAILLQKPAILGFCEPSFRAERIISR
jgi:hypothetical protein